MQNLKSILDKTDFQGRIAQSLRFDVRSCNSTGGWGSPGFTNEFEEIGKFEGEGDYKLSFWIRNEGSKYRVNAGGVSPFKGHMKTLVESSESSEEWTFYEFDIHVPEENHLRMELNILQPGTLWIDDVRVKKRIRSIGTRR